MIEITTLLAIAGGMAAFAAAIKALPVFWKFIKNIFKFLTGLEKIAKLPDLTDTADHNAHSLEDILAAIEEITITLSGLDQRLVDHMIEEEAMRAHEVVLVKELVDSFSNQSSDVFRQTTFASEVAYGEMIRIPSEDADSPDAWQWSWINTAFSELTGMSQAEAASIGWVDTIVEEDRARVVPTVLDAAEDGEDIEIEFTLLNLRTDQNIPVRVIASALLDEEGNAVRYLGAIHTMNSGVTRSIQSGFSAISRQVGTPSHIAHYELRLNEKTGVFEMVWANEAWEKLTGVSVRLARVSYWELVEPEEAKELAPELIRAGNAGEDIDVNYCLVNAKTDLQTEVRMVGHPVFTPTGTVSGYFGSLYVVRSEDEDVTIDLEE